MDSSILHLNSQHCICAIVVDSHCKKVLIDGIWVRPLFLLFNGKVCQLGQFHHLAAVQSDFLAVVNAAVAPDFTVTVFLKIDVDAELGFENIKQVSCSLLFFKGEWFAVCSLDFADVGRNSFLLLTLLTLELFDILNFSFGDFLLVFPNNRT